MAKVTLTRVVLHNFGPFVGANAFDLDPSGLVSVSGKNCDTDGESGAGKSYILHGITYAFGCARLSAKEMQCWNTDDPMKVEVFFDTAEGPAVLTRGSKLSLKIGDKLFKGSASAVEAELDRITGVNAKLRAMLTYRGQKQPGVFLSMTDGEKKEFFIDVLGLHWAEKVIAESDEKVKQLKKDVDAEQAKVDVARAGVTYAQSQLIEFVAVDDSQYVAAHKEASETAELVERELSDTVTSRCNAEEMEAEEAKAAREQFSGMLGALEAKIAAKRNEWKSATFDNPEVERLNAKIDECRRRRQALGEKETQRQHDYNRETQKLRDLRDQLQRQVAESDALLREKAQIQRDVITLEVQRCQTCSRPWDGAQAELEKKQQRLIEIDVKIADTLEVARKADELKVELAARKFEPDPMLKKYDDYERHLLDKLAEEKAKVTSAKAVAEAEARAYVSDVKQQIAELQKKAGDAANAILQSPDRMSLRLANEERRLQAELRDCKERVHDAYKQIKDVEIQNGLGKAQSEQTKRNLARAQQLLESADKALQQAQSKFNAESDFLGMMKGFLNAIFDEILDEISDESNAALAQLPNVAHLTIRFVSDYQTAKGTTKQAITPVVQFNGQQRPLTGCSGGMETSVELAVDLAVARVVGRRKNVELGWLILDEAFTGHDQVTKEGCLEVLQQYASDRLVLVVDHGSEAKEMFTNKIFVVHEGGRSRIAA